MVDVKEPVPWVPFRPDRQLLLRFVNVHGTCTPVSI